MARAKAALRNPRKAATTGAALHWGTFVPIAFALVALAVGMTPLGASQVTDLPLLSVGLTALVLSVAGLTPRALRAIASWRVVWAGVAWLVWALAAVALSSRPASAFLGVSASMLGWLSVACVGIIVAFASLQALRLRRALLAVAPWVLLVEGLLVAWEWSVGRHPDGTLTNSSYTGLVIALLLPLTLALARNRAEPSWRRTVGWIGAVAGVMALVLGDARNALVAVTLYAVVSLLAEVGKRRHWSSRRTATSAVSALVALAVAVGILLSVTASRTMATGFLADRSRWWVPALRAIANRPVAGYGPDGYDSGIYRLVSARSLNPAGGFAQLAPDPHNIFLWVTVSTGVVGLALFVWLLVEVGRNWRSQTRLGDSERPAPFVAGVLLYGLGVMTNPAALQTLPLFALVLAASLRVNAREAARAPGMAFRALRWLAVAIAAVTLVLAVTRLSIGRVDRPDQGNPGLTSTFASIWRVDPFLYYRASIDWGYAVQRDPSLKSTRPDLAAIRRAVALEPDNPVYRSELARTLAYYDEPPAVVESAFRDALALFPLSLDARGGWAEYLMARGLMDEAGQVLEDTLPELMNVELLRLAVEYYERTGDAVKAERYRQDVAAALAQARVLGYE